MSKIKVGITAGDPNGVGYEILLKLFADGRIMEFFTPVIYGSRTAAEFYKYSLRDNDTANFNYIGSCEKLNPGRVNFINVGPETLSVEPGKSTMQAGEISVLSLQSAVKDIKRGALDVLVTGPIDKNNTYSESFPYVGHTEYLKHEFIPDTNPLMFMVSDYLKVGLVTMHTSLSKVPETISSGRVLEHIKLIKKSLEYDFSSTNPKIAVLSLNPHCGDGGVIGKEEADIIIPAIEMAKNENIIACGPFAADGFFGSGLYSKYDAVLAMYHDQGLAPFKTIACGLGVNFTAGLPIVRTSPAHGVAYDISGSGKADIASFREAIFKAIDIYRNREINDSLSLNPLKYTRKRGNADKIHKEQNVDEMLPSEME